MFMLEGWSAGPGQLQWLQCGSRSFEPGVLIQGIDKKVAVWIKVIMTAPPHSGVTTPPHSGVISIGFARFLSLHFFCLFFVHVLGQTTACTSNI
jgi:hypothetical protein